MFSFLLDDSLFTKTLKVVSLSYLNFLSHSYALNKESIVMLKIIDVECPTNTSFSMSPLSPIM